MKDVTSYLLRKPTSHPVDQLRLHLCVHHCANCLLRIVKELLLKASRRRLLRWLGAVGGFNKNFWVKDALLMFFLLLEHVLVPTLKNFGDSQKMWKTWPSGATLAFPTAMPNLCTSRAEEKENSLADGCENPCRTVTTNEPLADNILWYTIYLYTGIVCSVI